MTDRVPYQHYVHPWIADEDDDDWGMTVPTCGCGERRIPGGRECADCLVARVHREVDDQAPFSPQWRRFRPTQIPQDGNE